MNFFKSGVRRLEQGLLEQLGATTSSKDASFDADDSRCVQRLRARARGGETGRFPPTASAEMTGGSARVEFRVAPCPPLRTRWTPPPRVAPRSRRPLRPLRACAPAAHPRRPPVFHRRSYRRLDDSLNRLNAGTLQYVSSLKRSCEDSRELVESLDAFASADLRYSIVPNAPGSVKFLDAVQSMLRVQASVKAAVARSVELMIVEKVITPLGNLLKAMPVLKRQMDARRQAVLGARQGGRGLGRACGAR